MTRKSRGFESHSLRQIPTRLEKHNNPFYSEKYPRGRRGSPAKGVGRLKRREGSNPSFSATSERVMLVPIFYFIKISPPLRCSSFSEKGRAAPSLLACKRSRDAPACYQPFSGCVRVRISFQKILGFILRLPHKSAGTRGVRTNSPRLQVAHRRFFFCLTRGPHRNRVSFSSTKHNRELSIYIGGSLF